jgi:hypothetical protein
VQRGANRSHDLGSNQLVIVGVLVLLLGVGGFAFVGTFSFVENLRIWSLKVADGAERAIMR